MPDELRQRIRLEVLQGGHSFYLDAKSRQRFQQLGKEFVKEIVAEAER